MLLINSNNTPTTAPTAITTTHQGLLLNVIKLIFHGHGIYLCGFVFVYF